MDPTYLGQPVPTPTAQKPAGLISKKAFLIVLVLLAAVAAGAFMLLGSGDKSGTLQQQMSARQATTQRIIEDGQKNISSDELSKLNSELRLVLIGDTNVLQGALATAGIKKIEKSINTAEADTASFDTLKDAKLNAKYDATYRNVLTQKLESLRALTTELHDETKSKPLKAALEAQYAHLTIYLNALAESS